MSAGAEVLVGLVMLVGLAGVVVPGLPGLGLVWLAGLAWALLDGGGAARWAVLALLTVLAVAGTLAPYVLPGRNAADRGAPWWVLAVGGMGMLVGFFVVPVVGVVLGGVVGVWAAELLRLRAPAPAWRSTRSVLTGYALGVLVQLGVGALMVGSWTVAAAVS
ncbi:MAG: DUF456 domain-containing protein [Motilibacteraceae bacterium]